MKTRKGQTGKLVNFRKFYTQEEVSFKNIATFIGCTNRSVSEIFYDPTGSRRFYELKCADKIDHELINKIDYLKLWQSVNESSPSILLNYRDELAERQKELRSMDSVEEFITQENLLPEEGDNTMEVKFSELYSAYSKWLSSQKLSGQFKKKRFASRLNELGVEDRRKSKARYRIIKECRFYEELLPQK